MLHKFRLKKEYIFRILVFLIWTQTILLQYVRAVIMRFPIVGNYADAIIMILYIAVILLSVSYYKVNVWDIAFVFSVAVVFMMEWLFYEDGREFLNIYIIDFIIKTLPLYIVGVSLSASKAKEKIIHQMYILSMLTLLANICYQYEFVGVMSNSETLYGNMYLAYNLLPHCCLIAYYAVKKTNIFNVIFMVIGALYLLMLGARGPAFLYIISIILGFIMGRKSKWAIVRGGVILGAITAFIASELYNAVILRMYQLARKVGLSARIFDKLMLGKITDESGRDVIRETLLMALKENPVIGYGICSDRVIAGSYAHNILLEMLVEYGVIIGTVLFIAVTAVIVFGFLSAEDKEEKGLIFSLIFASFAKLFFSGSYLEERLLFLLLGMCVYSIRRRKNSENDRLRRKV